MTTPRTTRIKALTLWAPHGMLIASGAKPYETRSWPTRYRGLLLIHQGVRFAAPERQLCRVDERFRSALMRAGMADPEDQPLGVALAVARLTDCVPTESLSLSYPERAFGDFSPGRWAWRVEVLHRIVPPVPMVGHQGLWDATVPESWCGGGIAQARQLLLPQEADPVLRATPRRGGNGAVFPARGEEA